MCVRQHIFIVTVTCCETQVTPKNYKAILKSNEYPESGLLGK